MSDQLALRLSKASLWEPFSERARRVVVLAQEEAQRLGNNFIGTEHILLGLISSEEDSVAGQCLKNMNITLPKVRLEVESIAGRGGQTVKQEMIFTPRAKRVFELAFEEARGLNHNYIGTEHLLLGLLREGEGISTRALTNIGVDPSKLRAAVLTRVNELITPQGKLESLLKQIDELLNHEHEIRFKKLGSKNIEDTWNVDTYIASMCGALQRAKILLTPKEESNG